MIIPIVAMAIPIVLVPVVLGIRHARLERELEHAERMKALELGRTLPEDEPWWTPPRISVGDRRRGADRRRSSAPGWPASR